MCIKNNSSGQSVFFFIFWTTYNYIVLFVMHQSITAVPNPSLPPPRLPRGICLPCQSRGWALANFAWPGGWAFDYMYPPTPELLTCTWFPILITLNMKDFPGNTSRLADWTELILGNWEQSTYVNGRFFF